MIVVSSSARPSTSNAATASMMAVVRALVCWDPACPVIDDIRFRSTERIPEMTSDALVAAIDTVEPADEAFPLFSSEIAC